ncbi:MAG: hypothetical protein ACRCXA_03285, partial [Peptostreptococcaceae bacterium]
MEIPLNIYFANSGYKCDSIGWIDFSEIDTSIDNQDVMLKYKDYTVKFTYNKPYKHHLLTKPLRKTPDILFGNYSYTGIDGDGIILYNDNPFDKNQCAIEINKVHITDSKNKTIFNYHFIVADAGKISKGNDIQISDLYLNPISTFNTIINTNKKTNRPSLSFDTNLNHSSVRIFNNSDDNEDYTSYLFSVYS